MFRSERPLVFVAPVYSWRLPRVVEQWIMENDFEGSRDAYFILTCGGSGGNAAVYAEKLCRRKGLHYRGLCSVLMPENYLALFPTPGESESREIIEKAGPVITDLARQIQSGETLTAQPVSLVGKIEGGKPVWKGRCTHCMACIGGCPTEAIEYKAKSSGQRRHYIMDDSLCWKNECPETL